MSQLFERIYYENNLKTKFLFEKIYLDHRNFVNMIKMYEKVLQDGKPPFPGPIFNKPHLSVYANHILWTLNNLDIKNKKAIKYDENIYKNKPFFVSQVGSTLKTNGITGSEIYINYEVIKEHHLDKGVRIKNLNHILTGATLIDVCNEINKPFMIQGRESGAKGLFLKIKIDGKYILVGIKLNTNNSIAYVSTIYGRGDYYGDNKTIYPIEDVIYIDCKNLRNEPDREAFMDLMNISTAKPSVQKEWKDYKAKKYPKK